MAVALAGWVLSPIDLIPEFVPVIGPLDDVVVVALALRYAARQVPREISLEAWAGGQSTPRATPRPCKAELEGTTDLARNRQVPSSVSLPRRPPLTCLTAMGLAVTACEADGSYPKI